MSRLTVIESKSGEIKFEAVGLPEDSLWQELIAYSLKDDYPDCNIWITSNDNEVWCVVGPDKRRIEGLSEDRTWL